MEQSKVDWVKDWTYPRNVQECYRQDSNPLSRRVTCDRATCNMHKSIAFEMSRRGGCETPRSVRLK